MSELKQYFENLGSKIEEIMKRPQKERLTHDILDTEKRKKRKLIALQEKQYQMKVGEIMQEACGTYHGYVNLKVGHETGVDILSEEKKVLIELKNRTNTDNSSSKKANLDKLARFKKINPEYRCIYANVNADTEEKTKQGQTKKIMHDGVELEQMVGYDFLQFIFGEDMHTVIEFIKDSIDTCLE